MKLCLGCKFLSVNTRFCTYEIGNQYHIFSRDIHTGRVYVRTEYPWLVEARAEDGACGPEAILYKPTLIRRIKNALRIP